MTHHIMTPGHMTPGQPTKEAEDQVLQPLLARLPGHVRDSFSEEQLAYLKLALGARKWGRHAIDWRPTIKWFRHRYYFVFLAGRDRRTLSRGERQIGLMLQAGFLTVLLTFSTLLGLLALYLAKSAAGIDLVPGFSLGIWSWFKSSFL